MMNGLRSRLPLIPVVLLLASCASVPSSPSATAEKPGSTSAAAALASSCSGCHANGTTGTEIVTLDGYTSEQISTRFQRYRQDNNGATAMHRMARGYTDEQIKLIADYLGQP